MSRSLSYSVLVALKLFLSGCAGFSTPPEPIAAPDSWSSHEQQLLATNQWRLTGKIGIRNSRESHSASLYWQQLQEHYEIELSGPFGQGGARIEGNGGGVMIDVAGEEPVHALSPELLMQRTLGWQFPIRELLYWVKGIPAPGLPYAPEFADNRLQNLNQKGWQIRYLRYTHADGVDLPGKLIISRGDLRITIVAKEWQIVAQNGRFSATN